MFYVLLSLLCIVLIVMTTKDTFKNVESPTAPISKKTTVAYDFDDCLKNVKTKLPLPDVVHNMLEDYNKGNRVIIVTARGKIGVPEIEDFLAEYNLDYKIEIFTTGDNLSRMKSPIICRENVDIFYDDQPGFLQDVADNCPNVILYQTFPNDRENIRPYKNRKRSRS